jgi:hypothetical protein
MMKKIIMVLLLLSLLSIPSMSIAQQGNQPEPCPDIGIKIVDLMIVRPLCIGVSAASTGLCAGLSPLTCIMGVGEASTRVLVEAPWRFTCARPLGDFTHYKDGKPITVVPDN